MWKFVNKQRGVISIFLVIVLLPMMTIASVMMDMSRIKLARSLAASAGDLTLNTGLSYYDNVLKEMYGLFAASQDYDTMMANLEEYYRGSISATGLSKAETDNYVKMIMDTIEGAGEEEPMGDLMNVDVLSVTPTIPDGANLMNPAMLKSQIVNFMKYRGPIDLGASLLDSLKSFSTIGEQQKVIEDKQKYYKEQANVIEKCQEAWVNLNSYSKLKLRNEYINIKKQIFDNLVNNYHKVSDNIIKDYFEGLPYFDRTKLTYATGSSGTYTFYYQGTSITADSISISSEGDVTSYASAVDSAIANYNTNLTGDPVTKLHRNETGGIYEIQRAIQFNRSLDESNGYANIVKAVYKAFANLKETSAAIQKDIDDLNKQIESLEDTIESCEDQISSLSESSSDSDSDSESDSEEEVVDNSALISSLEETISSCSTQITEINNKITERTKWKQKADQEISNRQGSFTSIMDKFVPFSALIKSTIENNANLELVKGTVSNAYVADTSLKLTNFYEVITTAKDYLEAAQGLLDDVLVSISEGGDLYNAEKNWDGSSNNEKIAGMAVSEQNKEELKNVKDIINKADLEDLLAHIDAAYVDLENTLTEIDNFKYGTLSIKDISSLEKAVDSLDEANLVMGLIQVSIVESELNTDALDRWTRAFKQPDTGFTTTWEMLKDPFIEDGGHPFYGYLSNTFKDAKKEDSDDFKKKKKEANGDSGGTVDDIESNAEQAKEDTIDNESEGSEKESIFTGDDLPSKLWGPQKDLILAKNKEQMDAYNKANGGGNTTELLELNIDDNSLGDKIIKMFSGLGGFLEQLGIDLRDDIYMAAYIMEMFSYDTMENEAIWEANGKPPGLSTATSMLASYASEAGSRVYDKDGNIKIKGSEAGFSNLVQKDLLTMTQIPISPKNNASYLSEVEYIIYGKNNSKSAYATIFGIRLAFNSIYAFSDTTIRQGAFSIASAIFGTPPLTFLVPIAQIAIIIAVALAESALDLQCIKAGMAVPLFKTKKTWMLSFQNLFQQVKDTAVSFGVDAAKSISEEIIDSSAKVINDWLDATGEELKEKSDVETAKLVAAVDDTINTAIEQYVGMVIDQLTTLCHKVRNMRASGEIKEGEEVETATTALEQWLDEDSEGAKDTIMYLAKKEAINYIINNNYISKVLDSIENMAVGGMEKAEVFNKEIEKLSRNITKQLINFNEKIKEYIDNSKNAIQMAINEGADSLKETIYSSLDKLEPKNSKANIEANVTASLFSFQYSDYLTVFLLISLIANQEAVLLRTSDVIQTNMALKQEGYQMSKAYTYLDLKATLEVKPVFMKLPFMPEDTEDLIKESSWYTIQYHGIQGY